MEILCINPERLWTSWLWFVGSAGICGSVSVLSVLICRGTRDLLSGPQAHLDLSVASVGKASVIRVICLARSARYVVSLSSKSASHCSRNSEIMIRPGLRTAASMHSALLRRLCMRLRTRRCANQTDNPVAPQTVSPFAKAKRSGSSTTSMPSCREPFPRRGVGIAVAKTKRKAKPRRIFIAIWIEVWPYRRRQ